MSTPARWATAWHPRPTAFVDDAVAGRKVRLDRDISDRDHYDRLLRYVFVDGTLVEEELVRQGLAEAIEYPPDTKYAAALESAQAEAKSAHRGIWGDSCDVDPPPPPPPPPADNCDSSYPSVCIPPAPPDLDCGDVDAENFTVLPPDPHGFDCRRRRDRLRVVVGLRVSRSLAA